MNPLSIEAVSELVAKIETLTADLAAAREEAARLGAALQHLVNECKWIQEDHLRYVYGNTNCNCFMERLADADDVIRGSRSALDEALEKARREGAEKELEKLAAEMYADADAGRSFNGIETRIAASTLMELSDLSRAVARLIEPEPPRPTKSGQLSDKEAWESPFLIYAWHPRPFASDRNLLPLIYEAVRERGKIREFVDGLTLEAYGAHVGVGWTVTWNLLNATPEQTCRAFLKACESNL